MGYARATFPEVLSSRGPEPWVQTRSIDSSWRGSNARVSSRRPSGQANAATADLRSHRAATDSSGDRRVSGGPVSGRGKAGRSAASFAHYGERMACPKRRRLLCRHARLSHRQPARNVAVARLGDQRPQSEHAVRRVRGRAACRRPAAQCRASRRSPAASTAIT
jgi:hypothetical protein